MNRIKRFDDIKLNESARVLSAEEIEDYFIEYVDNDTINIKSDDKDVIDAIRQIHIYSNKKFIYKNSEKVDKWEREVVKINDYDSYKKTSFLVEIKHPMRIKGNLDLNGYTIATIADVLRRFVEITKKEYLVDIFVEIIATNMYHDPLSECIITVVYLDKKLNEESEEKHWELEQLEDIFVELGYYKNHKLPIKCEFSFIGETKYYKNFKVQIEHDFYDKYFIEKFVENTSNMITNSGYQIYRKHIMVSGRYSYKDIPVHGKDYTTRVSDPILFTNIYLKKKKEIIKENNSNDVEEVLLIIDVQKSFKKFFTEVYLHHLKEYCKNFKQVYQIFDNHVDGKKVSKDYLYDEDHEVSLHDDLYYFPNQVDIIEKRYNYNVDVDFYKKILDKETYKKAKELETNNKLKVGDTFETKGGTIIVYVGNNHKFFHLPKKLYDLLFKLKGKRVSIVGGADSECLSDVFTAAESLGVDIKRNWKYIYSASHSPL
jgi:hypothetical protein